MVHLALVTGDYLMLNSEFLAECVFVFCRLWLWYYFLEVALFGSWFHGKDGLSSLKQSITYLSVCWPKQGLRKLILCLLFILVCEITCFEWQCSEAMISVIMLDWGRRRMLLLEACVQKLLSQVSWTLKFINDHYMKLIYFDNCRLHWISFYKYLKSNDFLCQVVAMGVELGLSR